MDTGSSPKIGKEKLLLLQLQPNNLGCNGPFLGGGEGVVPHSLKHNITIYSKPEVMRMIGSRILPVLLPTFC